MSRFCIIGGGVIGASIGLSLAKRKAGEVTILEKESGLGAHASGRNSGVIHSGINQKPGSLKAKMCLEGSRRLREYCKKRQIPMSECGTLVVARSPREIEVIEKLLQMGKECGVDGLRILNRLQLTKREPMAIGQTALFSPTGAVVDSLAFLESVADDARDLGVEFLFHHEVVKIEANSVVTQQGEIKCDHIINCAGLFADRVAQMMGVGGEYRVIPFRGEYFEVKNCKVRGMIYQPPDLRFPFLSIHLTREVDGRVLAGPSAVLALGREAYHKEWDWSEMVGMFLSKQFFGLMRSAEFVTLAFHNAKTSISRKAFLREIQSLAEGIREENLVPAKSGIRAQMVDATGKMVDDLLIIFKENSTHILNAVSPGMTCSLAFADYVVDQILK